MTSAARLAQRLVDDQRRKATQTLAAQYALRGFELVELGDGSFSLGRWGLWRWLPNLEAAQSFARQVGAAG